MSTTRPIKTSLEQIIRAAMSAFQNQNFGKVAKFVYLPVDLYDHFTDIIEDKFREGGVSEAELENALRYFYNGAEVLECRTNDILVTAELLP